MKEADQLEKLIYTRERLALKAPQKGADERLVADVRESLKVPFRVRWKQNGRHCQYYTSFFYACISSAVVFKAESRK
jgi:hypothetical protein